MSIEQLNHIKAKGLNDESKVIHWLKENTDGLSYRQPSKAKNVEEDIDVVIDDVSYSIKCDGSHSLNVAFELSQYSEAYGQWLESWYYTGRASYYIVWKKRCSEVYIISKRKLVRYINENKWDREVGLTAEAKATQQFHDRTDTKLGLLGLQLMLDNGIAILLGEMEE